MPNEDLQEVAKDLGLPRNVTLDPSWYLRNMKLDPLRWYVYISYGVLVAVTLHTFLYTHKAELITMKQEVLKVLQAKLVTPAPIVFDGNPSLGVPAHETKAERKFWEKKSTIVSAGPILILICMGFAFLVPMGIVRRITRDDINAINTWTGRVWIYISRVAVPMSHQFMFPLFILVSNSKMRSSLMRDIKELELFVSLVELKTRLMSYFRRDDAQS